MHLKWWGTVDRSWPIQHCDINHVSFIDRTPRKTLLFGNAFSLDKK